MAARTVSFNREEFDALCRAKGWYTLGERADGLGLSEPQISKAQSGKTTPGAVFVDQCVKVFGLYDEAAYARLFPEKEQVA